MNVFIMPNYDKNNAVECTEKVCLKLHELGGVCLMTDNDKAFIEREFIIYDDFETQLDKADVIVAIGGDGTIIHSAKYAVRKNLPILGINAGRLGFLAGIEQDELDYLSKLINNTYTVEKRMFLEIKHSANPDEVGQLALNDVVVSKGALSRLVDLDIYCMDKNVSSYRADGVVFATPTGSTAYSLSVGGPIIEPSMNSIAMTPISPHSLFGRTILFSDENVLKIKLGKHTTSNAYITVDGEQAQLFERDDEVQIKKSDKYVKMITLYDKPFYEVLNKKILMRADSLVEEMG